jgi:3-methylfumaryl-CoA hydratase
MGQYMPVQIGQRLEEHVYTAGTVQLFLYNAAIWNAHRIHYDLPYTTEQEGHPALLVDGPLQGDWLTQLVYEWMEQDDELRSFHYSNRRAAYVGEALTATGEVTAVDGERITFTLKMTNPQGEVTTQGTAMVWRAGSL